MSKRKSQTGPYAESCLTLIQSSAVSYAYKLSVCVVAMLENEFSTVYRREDTNHAMVSRIATSVGVGTSPNATCALWVSTTNGALN